MFGFIGDLLGGSATKKAAKRNDALATGFETKGNQYIDTGSAEAKDYLGQAGDVYSGLADRSLGNLDYYKNALGLNGADGSASALSAFQTGPGYEFQMNQGLDALDRRAAARGQLNSGNTSIDTLNYSQGLANQEWGGYLDRLQGFDSQQNANYLTGLGGKAGSLGSLADLAGQTTDRRLGLGASVLGARMGANNQYASGANQQAQGFGGMLGGIAGLALGYQ
jgi:hypothetical protein